MAKWVAWCSRFGTEIHHGSGDLPVQVEPDYSRSLRIQTGIHEIGAGKSLARAECYSLCLAIPIIGCDDPLFHSGAAILIQSTDKIRIV